MNSLSAIILTYNEEKHLSRCLESLIEICNEIIIVDSYSNDGTEKISREFKTKFFQNPWINHSSQLNWAIKNTNIKSDWILRIDADEYLTQ